MAGGRVTVATVGLVAPGPRIVSIHTCYACSGAYKSNHRICRFRASRYERISKRRRHLLLWGARSGAMLRYTLALAGGGNAKGLSVFSSRRLPLLFGGGAGRVRPTNGPGCFEPELAK